MLIFCTRWGQIRYCCLLAVSVWDSVWDPCWSEKCTWHVSSVRNVTSVLLCCVCVCVVHQAGSLGPACPSPRLDHGQHIYGLFVAVQTLWQVSRALLAGVVGGMLWYRISPWYLSSNFLSAPRPDKHTQLISPDQTFNTNIKFVGCWPCLTQNNCVSITM